MIWLSEFLLLITNEHWRMVKDITTINIEYKKHKLIINYVLNINTANINLLLVSIRFKRAKKFRYVKLPH